MILAVTKSDLALHWEILLSHRNEYSAIARILKSYLKQCTVILKFRYVRILPVPGTLIEKLVCIISVFVIMRLQ